MSPKQTVTTEQTVQTEIRPEVAARLAALVSTLNEIKFEAGLLDEAMDIEKAKIFEILQTEGIDKVDVQGTGLAIVRGTSSRLDKVKFVQLGGSLAQLEAATIVKPKKPYLRVGADKTESEAA
jgi:hypothetical protein